MQHLAAALAIAVSCIEDLVSDADADVKALEAIASEIQQGSLGERLEPPSGNPRLQALWSSQTGRNQHWVKVDNQYLLIAGATGLIAGILAAQ